MNNSQREQELESRIRALEAQIAELRAEKLLEVKGDTVRVPDEIKPIFDAAQETVGKYFSETTTDPTKATIEISGERYVLLRASSLSFDFLNTIKNLYADLGEEEAFAVGRNFLFDISHVIGMQDAKNFHKKMGVTEPIAKLSAGPVHFAYSGWAFVDISPDSAPNSESGFFLKYNHPFSFEADAWMKAGQRSNQPVCIMSAGYSSGWCEESFGFELTAVEISCKAAGDENCTFIMAQPNEIEKHLASHIPAARKSKKSTFRIPTFFERKRVEEEMKTARRKAEESDRMKSEFLANMSHELRTPMNAVIGMTELVLDTELTHAQREQLGISLDSAESMMNIINQILDFSKIEAGKMQLDSIPFSLRECVGETMKSLAHRAQAKNLELTWRIAADVPDKLRGDAGRIRQIIVNLVGNSIKFTDEGEITADVSLADSSSKQVTLEFKIRDTGMGVPEDKRQSIFDAFTQVDMSMTRRFGGTGLGLTICSELAKLMNGRIWVESPKSGKGSVFRFTAQLGRQMLKTAAVTALADLPVLVVAESKTNRKILEETLMNLGLQVSSVGSTAAALNCLANKMTAGNKLVVADISKEMALIESIRNRDEFANTMIVLLLSGHRPGDLQKYDDLVVDACLRKPVKTSDLIDAIVRAKQLHAKKIKAHQRKPEKQPTKQQETVVTTGSPSVKSEPTKSGAGINILLVEDGIANQKFAVAMLSRWGHSVSIANNGREALELLRDSPNYFDLILMDVLMPEMDGLEATAAIREQESGSGERIPIVAITAQAMKGDREKCLAAGMDDYLSKPIRRRELHEAIQKHIES